MESVHKMVILDEEDRWILDKHSWSLNIFGYAKSKINCKIVLLHYLLMDKKENYVVDHINRNPLDNRRCNLRYATYQQNTINRKAQKNNKSGYRGVSLYKNRNYCKWRARIKVNEKSIYIGYYKNKIDAAKAYNKAAKKYFGDFAVLNKVK